MSRPTVDVIDLERRDSEARLGRLTEALTKHGLDWAYVDLDCHFADDPEVEEHVTAIAEGGEPAPILEVYVGDANELGLVGAIASRLGFRLDGPDSPMPGSE